MWAEVKKELLLVRRYAFNMVMLVIIMYLVFLQLFYSSKTLGSYSSILEKTIGSGDYIGFVLVGLIFWNISLRSIGDLAAGINRDNMTGTIEQILIAPSRNWFLISGRSIASVIITLTFLIFITVPLILIFSIDLNWDILPLAIILIFTFIGIQGFSLILVGIQFLVRNIGQFIQLLNFIFLYLCGIIFPVELLPNGISFVSHLLPITYGLESARAILLGNMTFKIFIESSLFYKLTIQSVIYYLIGIAMYYYFITIARKKGVLGKY